MALNKDIDIDIDNDSDDEYEFDYESFCRSKNLNIDLKHVDMLYDYFANKGLGDNSIKYNWRIEKHHIHAALRRNKGDINSAGKDLDEMIDNYKFEIRTFYDKYDNIITNPVNKKPYLSDQEWQINPEEGIYLVKDSRVFKITSVYGSVLHLDIVLTKDIERIDFNDNDVKYGEFKSFNSENLSEYLEDEYAYLKKRLDELLDKKTRYLYPIYTDIKNTKNKIDKIREDHLNNCISDCNHEQSIKYLQEEVEELYDYIDDGYEPYEDLKYKITVAGHVLDGDYEDWINDY